MNHIVATTFAPAYCIALDWGSSSLRAYLMNHQGQVLDNRSSAEGILATQNFKVVLQAICTDWDERYGKLSCIACGMIGSQQGWKDAGYLSTPTELESLALNAIDIAHLADRPFWIVPGIKHETATTTDVMRGEETQVFGAGIQNGLAILPGTHSKWVTIENGHIKDLQTYMTGEVFALLKTHSILSKFMPAIDPTAPQPTFDLASFVLGLEQTLTNPAELLARLFSSRTQGLFKRLSPAQQPDYLSGILIGTEVGAALQRYKPTSVTLIGEVALTQRYEEALRQLNVAAELPAGNPPVAAMGLHRIAKSLV
jgi:2-dehydro-3-deoxygalactonokinase